MPGTHDRIIAEAAKQALGPLGFKRNGRSRTWIADHGWWLTVVEFQPSAWSKGSYLNVAAHWLWSETGSLSFDLGGRVEEHTEYFSDAQFTPVAFQLAQKAAEEARRLAHKCSSLETLADILLADQQVSREHGGGGWMTYNAGVAAALAGRTDAAAEMFERVLRGSAPRSSTLKVAAKRMGQLAPDPAHFKTEVALLIARQREALKLPPSDQLGP